MHVPEDTIVRERRARVRHAPREKLSLLVLEMSYIIIEFDVSGTNV